MNVSGIPADDNPGEISGEVSAGAGPAFRALECRYPTSYFVKSYLRIALGAAALTAIAFSAPERAWLSAGLGVLLAGIAVYALQTFLRQRSRLKMDEAGLHVSGPRSFDIQWSDLKKVELAYFSTRRDGSNGWMQLKIVGGKRTLRIDSDLTDFNTIVIETLRQADFLGLDVGRATRHNAAVLCK